MPRHTPTETSQGCPCGRPTPSSSYLCQPCLKALWIALGDTPALIQELGVTLARQRRFTSPTGPSKTSQGLPYDLRASQAIDELMQALNQLTQRFLQAGFIPPPHSLDS